MKEDPGKHPGRLKRMISRPARGLLDNGEDELHAFVRGPLLPRPVFRVLLGVFFVCLFLASEWFGLLLINADGVVRQIGILWTLRTVALLMAGISVSSVLLMLHYRRLYTYESGENVFFAIAFSLSFLMGSPCALVGFFG